MCMNLEQKIRVQICALLLYIQLYRKKYAYVFTKYLRERGNN